MTERMAYVNGFVPESAASVSIFDKGVQLGQGVYERTRTFEHGTKTFRLDEHLARLQRSLRAIRLDPGLSMAELKEVTLDLAARNRDLLGPNDDYSIGHYITRGRPGGPPTVIIFTEPIPFKSFAREYLEGGHAVTAVTRALPTQVIDPKMKTTSRMHFWLAEIEAHLVDPKAYPLVLDLDGNVTELTAANFWIVRDGVVITPPDRSILGGISRGAVLDVARDLGIPVAEQNFQVYDVRNADEAFLTTTTRSVLPITQVDGGPIGDGKPGPIVARLQNGWTERFGFDFVAQALSHLEDDEAAEARATVQA
jgi:branched-chain amino acid aminotransferase